MKDIEKNHSFFNVKEFEKHSAYYLNHLKRKSKKDQNIEGKIKR